MVKTVTDFIHYLQYEKRLSQHTVIAYQTDLEQFTSFCSDSFSITDIQEIESVIIRSWIMTLIEEQISTRSINRKLSTLKSYFNYHIRLGNITKSPINQISSPKISKRLPEFVSQEDMETLFSSDLFEDTYEGWRDRAIIELFYFTGMRLSELINIKRTDIDFWENSVKIMGKRSKERIVPIGPTVRDVLKKHIDLSDEKWGEVNKKSYIFVTPKNTKMYPKAIYNIVRKYLDMITTIDKRSPHVIRHTFATHLLNNGADINVIKEILGHSSLAATQIYTHNSIEKLKSIYKQAHPRA